MNEMEAAINVSVPSRGLYILNKIKGDTDEDDYFVSVPSRGLYILNDKERHYDDGQNDVSVPSRGLYILNNMRIGRIMVPGT